MKRKFLLLLGWLGLLATPGVAQRYQHFSVKVVLAALVAGVVGEAAQGLAGEHRRRDKTGGVKTRPRRTSLRGPWPFLPLGGGHQLGAPG